MEAAEELGGALTAGWLGPAKTKPVGWEGLLDYLKIICGHRCGWSGKGDCTAVGEGATSALAAGYGGLCNSHWSAL